MDSLLREEDCEARIRAMTPAEWQPLFSLIPEIERTERFGELLGGDPLPGGGITMPSWGDAPIVQEFLRVVYAIPIIIVFPWGDWELGKTFWEDPEAEVDSLDIVTKCKLITTIVRADLFCEGALAAAFASGQMLRLLKSMEEEVCPQDGGRERRGGPDGR